MNLLTIILLASITVSPLGARATQSSNAACGPISCRWLKCDETCPGEYVAMTRSCNIIRVQETQLFCCTNS
ncbi:uncharacterized protein EDB91DRAFT_1124259 [Suillus paluster]|uniref:uncharacterized protein n=1 Tax=Suillus paluster TaxID=48578 RepID=UPI001B876D85|nr:uncharacterized protein EDB91DRAFT_1124259 [Suillus paluster]KAG1744042.1 hypothetical protein EDB91DRAFT_1124259 [Suillus paluster]